MIRTIAPMLALLLGAASGPRAGTPEGEKKIDLAFAEADPVALRYTRTHTLLDEGTGCGRIPFATASGALELKLLGDDLVVDLDGDGRISEKEQQKKFKAGESFSLRVDVGGRAVDYGLQVSYLRKPYVMLQGRGILKGEVDGASLTLIDANVNGRFGEAGQDRIRFGNAEPSVEKPWEGPLPLGKILSLEDRLYDASFENGGTRLLLKPRRDPAATIDVAENKATISCFMELAHKEEGLFFGRLVSGSKATLPPGTYVIGRTMAALAPPKEGAQDQAGMIYGATPKEIDLKAGETTLAVGPPLRLEFAACRQEDGAYSVKEVNLVGAAGEAYRGMVFSTQPKSTLSYRVEAGGKQVASGSELSYG